MNEKIDGIRAHWNGQVLTSKRGAQLRCPVWFTEGFPNYVSLDGELWLGRGTFELLCELLGFGDPNGWKRVSFIAFDLPSCDKPYEIRMRDLANVELPHHVRVVDIKRCKGNHQLQQHLANVVDHGGEGLMAHKPNSIYVSHRVETLQKVKV